jgi:MFS family permease
MRGGMEAVYDDTASREYESSVPIQPTIKTLCPLSVALGGLVALAAAVGVGRFVCTPILPFMLEDLGMTKGTAGLMASANFLGHLVGALLAATPILPSSRRRWLVSALIASSLQRVPWQSLPPLGSS